MCNVQLNIISRQASKICLFIVLLFHCFFLRISFSIKKLSRMHTHKFKNTINAHAKRLFSLIYCKDLSKWNQTKLFSLLCVLFVIHHIHFTPRMWFFPKCLLIVLLVHVLLLFFAFRIWVSWELIWCGAVCDMSMLSLFTAIFTLLLLPLNITK